ncbi:hypothetical protein [Colwellia sp. E2M01]|uniref:hypothetical protein n=1 Tax=Colwellia sp. E2M01 TaxID=2841561 RepID=UPI001C09CA2D|nr:hypothetical protein [Colwellia sp. E2M01]MBU2871371.1 hypothetical protein [Colwellia sp. E2M01]
MKLDKFLKCNCGKKKKINWIDKADFRARKTTFCVGVSECPKCQMQQQHYSGNMEDIQRFLSYVESQPM